MSDISCLVDNSTKEIHNLGNPVMDCKLSEIQKKDLIFLKSQAELNNYLDQEEYSACPFCLREYSEHSN